MAAAELSGLPTLADLASRLAPDGSMADIVNVLETEKPILADIVWKESNLATGHLVTQAVNALPGGGWRQINQGTSVTKGQTAQYVESCGILEAWTEIDERLYELNGGDAYRKSEDDLKREQLAQTLGTAYFYSNIATAPSQVHGLSPRFASTSSGVAQNYVLNGNLSDNAGANARSIWMIAHGAKVYCVYPKGTRAGLEMKDLGSQRVLDSSSRPYVVLSTQHVWRVGIVVEDYRYIVRAQWDPDSADMDDSERGLIQLMGKLHSTIYRAKGATIYMDRTSVAKLNAQMIANDMGPLRYLMGDGGQLAAGVDTGVATFNGFKVRVEDSLVAETAIS